MRHHVQSQVWPGLHVCSELQTEYARCSGQAGPCAALDCAPWGAALYGAAAVHTTLQANQRHSFLQGEHAEPSQPRGCALTLSSSPCRTPASGLDAGPSGRRAPAPLGAAPRSSDPGPAVQADGSPAVASWARWTTGMPECSLFCGTALPQHTGRHSVAVKPVLQHRLWSGHTGGLVACKPELLPLSVWARGHQGTSQGGQGSMKCGPLWRVSGTGAMQHSI